ncbi:MAG TPA: SDR family oxidoreductase [Rugosimonospora sp.]|nr:SDR family oxidoreductase [Rugosimonospora sp.]
MSTTWFITGTSSGFGRQLTEQLLAGGQRVAATARNTASLSDLATRYGERLWTATLDVTDTPALRAVVERAFADLGRIDVVVSNAGYAVMGAAEELSDEQITREIDTNLVGSIQLARAVIPHLRTQGGGRFIQMSTEGGQMAFPGLSLYHASKWGIEGFIEAVAAETATFGIEYTLVEPGGARTDFGGRSMDVASPLPAYDTVLAAMRARVADPNVAQTSVGDPAKIAAAIIASADQTPAPRRLTLGSDAYRLLSAALRSRLDALEAQKSLAHTTDVTD